MVPMPPLPLPTPVWLPPPTAPLSPWTSPPLPLLVPTISLPRLPSGIKNQLVVLHRDVFIVSFVQLKSYIHRILQKKYCLLKRERKAIYVYWVAQKLPQI